MHNTTNTCGDSSRRYRIKNTDRKYRWSRNS